MAPLRLSTGLDVLLQDPSLLGGKRIGLLCNPASVTSGFVPAWRALRDVGYDVSVLFGPEHGFWGAALADGDVRVPRRRPGHRSPHGLGDLPAARERRRESRFLDLRFPD